MTRPLLSLVVPAFQARSTLGDCLDSLLAVGEGTEILVVDDGSEDDTAALAEAQLASRPGSRVLRTPNRGPGAARNLGLREARGRHVLFVDSDDLVLPEALQGALRLLDRDGTDLLAADYLQTFGGTGRTERVRRGFPPGLNGPEGAERLRRCLLFRHFKPLVWAHIFRRDRLLEEGVFFLEGRFFEDEEWMPRAILAARTLQAFPEPWYLYRRRGGSISAATSLRKVEDKVFVAREMGRRGDGVTPPWKDFFRYAEQRILKSARRDLATLPREEEGREVLEGEIARAWTPGRYWWGKAVQAVRARFI